MIWIIVPVILLSISGVGYLLWKRFRSSDNKSTTTATDISMTDTSVDYEPSFVGMVQAIADISYFLTWDGTMEHREKTLDVEERNLFDVSRIPICTTDGYILYRVRLSPIRTTYYLDWSTKHGHHLCEDDFDHGYKWIQYDSESFTRSPFGHRVIVYLQDNLNLNASMDIISSALKHCATLVDSALPKPITDVSIIKYI